MGFFENYARKIGRTENVLAFSVTGTAQAGEFSGNPKKASVTLSQAQPNGSYSVSICGLDARAWTVESRTASGFVINSNADTALTGSVTWSIGGNV